VGGGGLFLTRTDGLAPGQEVSLRFRPARHLPIISAKGCVRYIVPEKGAGVEFTEISPEDRRTLLRLIHLRTADRRHHPRAPLATQIECDRCMTLAFSRDVSLGGMFIETTEPLPVDESLTVRFNLSPLDKVVSTTARVTYQLVKMGMGVVFTNLSAEDRKAIREYIELPEPAPGEESATSQQA
jgi:type IV pilus assembly protein PilZ